MRPPCTWLRFAAGLRSQQLRAHAARPLGAQSLAQCASAARRAKPPTRGHRPWVRIHICICMPAGPLRAPMQGLRELHLVQDDVPDLPHHFPTTEHALGLAARVRETLDALAAPLAALHAAQVLELEQGQGQRRTGDGRAPGGAGAGPRRRSQGSAEAAADPRVGDGNGNGQAGRARRRRRHSASSSAAAGLPPSPSASAGAGGGRRGMAVSEAGGLDAGTAPSGPVRVFLRVGYGPWHLDLHSTLIDSVCALPALVDLQLNFSSGCAGNLHK